MVRSTYMCWQYLYLYIYTTIVFIYTTIVYICIYIILYIFHTSIILYIYTSKSMCTIHPTHRCRTLEPPVPLWMSGRRCHLRFWPSPMGTNTIEGIGTTGKTYCVCRFLGMQRTKIIAFRKVGTIKLDWIGGSSFCVIHPVKHGLENVPFGWIFPSNLHDFRHFSAMSEALAFVADQNLRGPDSVHNDIAGKWIGYPSSDIRHFIGWVLSHSPCNDGSLCPWISSPLILGYFVCGLFVLQSGKAVWGCQRQRTHGLWGYSVTVFLIFLGPWISHTNP